MADPDDIAIPQFYSVLLDKRENDAPQFDAVKQAESLSQKENMNGWLSRMEIEEKVKQLVFRKKYCT